MFQAPDVKGTKVQPYLRRANVVRSPSARPVFPRRFASPERASSFSFSCARLSNRSTTAARQGLTLVHFSAQHEPCLTQENTLHTLNTP